jgi:hypothetical protein
MKGRPDLSLIADLEGPSFISRITHRRLDRRITQDDYDKKARELKEQQAEIATRIEQRLSRYDEREHRMGPAGRDHWLDGAGLESRAPRARSKRRSRSLLARTK